jgi:apyrase
MRLFFIYIGEYVYGSVNYRAVGSASGADYDECQELVVKALKKDHACDHMQCTFGGVWNGGGGDGQKKLLVASFFFDRALQVF